MKKRRVILLAAILALASVVTISVWPDASPEPRYNGRKLSDWVLDYPQAGASDEAEAAIRAIGTNAIPCLLRWIQYEPSRGRMKVRHVYRLLPGWLRNRQFVISFLAGRAGILSSKAPLAFAVLGTNSAPAVPELMKLAQSTNSVALTAVFVLSEMRDAGLSGTLTIMTNGTLQQRLLAARILQTTLPLYTNAVSAVPALVICLHDPDAEIVSVAAMGLARLKSDPTNVVPELLATLHHPNADVRKEAVWALYNYGDPATMPALSNCVHDPNPLVREAATRALEVFRGEVPRMQ